jgi:glycosyltransferase involved in cell wall biosynthesis
MAPTGQVLHALGRTLTMRGHEVRVVCSRRSYDGGEDYPTRETLDGVEIHRLPAFGFGRRGAGRLLDYASFYLLLTGATLLGGARPDLVLALSTPPYIGLVGSLLRRFRGSAHAHWVMDVYPDVLVAHGMAGSRGPIRRALSALMRVQFKSAAAVLALGPYMQDRLRPYANGVRLDWIPLWGEGSPGPAPPENVARMRAERGWSTDDLVLMYSGNMGLGHRFDDFLEAAQRLGRNGPLWAFIGGGGRRAEIERFAAAHPATRLQLLPYVSRERVRDSLCAGDVHLVSLRAAWQGLIVPSKVQAVFSVGRPIIFVGPRENETRRWIEESGGGWIVPEGDVEALLAAVGSARDGDERRRRGDAALAYAREHFDPERNCDRIAELLEEAASAISNNATSGSGH